MSIFKCKMCGGALEIKENQTVAECEYCGTRQTLPKLSNDRRANLYDRANHFRRNNEFDKAMVIYENILSEDGTDAEAYWSLVLCRYGIEYVEDPATHKRVPTVNRAQFTSIFDDDNYRSAISHADSYQKSIYEAEAKTINEIQKGILAISQQEKPFDVFICYKETDTNGRRTQDSVLANDLYHQLTAEGFKVFFSRITLEDKLGVAYEPYIFAALNSAKVMVVLGTRPEYFKAVWVKNEWSRYLSLVKQSSGKKILIPAYRDMDPYDLPEEFSHLQAQDMSKLGFMQDLIRGIQKLTQTEAPKPAFSSTPAVNNNTNKIALFLKRVFMFLEDGEWRDANDYCEKILDMDPECAEAYLGKLMVMFQCHDRDELKDLPESFEKSSYYTKVLRFAPEAMKAELQGYIDHINYRNEQNRLQGIYDEGLIAMDAATNERSYIDAAEIFQSISEFKDARNKMDACMELARECREKAEAEQKEKIYLSACQEQKLDTVLSLNHAIKLFSSIEDWKNADVRITACQKRIEEIQAEHERQRILNEKINKLHNLIKVALVVAACAAIAYVIIYNTFLFPYRQYNKALALLGEGNFAEAYAIFVELEDFKDSQELADKYSIYGCDVLDIVTFGKYEQDNDITNGKEPIEWIVLAKEDNRILVISKNVLDCQPYHATSEYVTWETCSLRKWLNETFINDAFSSDDQRKIVPITLENPENTNFDTPGGNDTTDKVFLPSIHDVNEYFRVTFDRVAPGTAYAISNGVELSNGEAAWWLRSPGYTQIYALGISGDGLMSRIGWQVDSTYYGVRPAMWITMD